MLFPFLSCYTPHVLQTSSKIGQRLKQTLEVKSAKGTCVMTEPLQGPVLPLRCPNHKTDGDMDMPQDPAFHGLQSYRKINMQNANFQNGGFECGTSKSTTYLGLPLFSEPLRHFQSPNSEGAKGRFLCHSTPNLQIAGCPSLFGGCQFPFWRPKLSCGCFYFRFQRVRLQRDQRVSLCQKMHGREVTW